MQAPQEEQENTQAMPQEQGEMEQLLAFIASLEDRITALEDLVKK